MTRTPATRPSPLPPPASRRAALALAAAGAVALLAFAVGRRSAEPSAPQRAERPAAAERAPAPSGRPLPIRPQGQLPGPTATAAAMPSAPVAVEAPSSPAPQGRPTPALVARVSEEARAVLEAARPELAGRCIPGGRLPDGKAGATFTFNVTFDASGREIARGIGEDRRYRAPEVARCLRSLPIGSLRVTPPGANVGVRVAMNLP